MTKIDVYQDVTNRIIEALEKGLDEKFELPWHGVSQIPENAHTGKRYKGVNVPLLWVYQYAPALRFKDTADSTATEKLLQHHVS